MSIQELGPPQGTSPPQRKIQRIEVQRAINGFLIITPAGVVVIQGDGSPHDMDPLLGAVRDVFEE